MLYGGVGCYRVSVVLRGGVGIELVLIAGVGWHRVSVLWHGGLL